MELYSLEIGMMKLSRNRTQAHPHHRNTKERDTKPGDEMTYMAAAELGSLRLRHATDSPREWAATHRSLLVIAAA